MQQNSDTFILESKLKRLKIAFSKENGRLVIAQARRDYTLTLGLIFFPLLFGIAGVVFVILNDFTTSLRAKNYVVTASLGLIVFGIYNITRFFKKSQANKNAKILGDKEIIIRGKENSRRFDAHTIHKFEYKMHDSENRIDEDNPIYGEVFLVDTNNEKHLLLGFYGETEQYLLDDLKWFTAYFEKHVGMVTF